MRNLLTFALVLVMAGSALAQLPNSMGIFFAEDEFTPATTNFDPEPGVSFEMYVAIINTTVNFVGAYECGIEVSDPSLFILGWGGPDAIWEGGEYVYPDGFSYGGLNFGDNFNHIAGFQYPLPTNGESTVLSKMQVLFSGTSLVEFFMGPSEPSSVGGAGPAITNGLDPEEIILCNLTSGPEFGGLVGTLNGQGIDFPVAAETQSWSGVKALFE